MTPGLSREAALFPEFAVVIESYLDAKSIRGLAQQRLRDDRRILAVVQSNSRPDLILKSLPKDDPAIESEPLWLRRADQIADLRPKLLDVLEWGERVLLVMAAAPHNGRPTDPDILRIAHRLAEADTTHGDFAPWNVKSRGDAILLIDWEEAQASYIEGFDVAHYAVQRALLIERKSPTHALSDILNPRSILPRFLLSTGAASHPAEALARYLVTTAQDARSAQKRNERLEMLGRLTGAVSPAE